MMILLTKNDFDFTAKMILLQNKTKYSQLPSNDPPGRRREGGGRA